MATVHVGYEYIEQKDYPVHEALSLLTHIVKGTYVSQISGIPALYLSMAKKPGNLHRGTPYRMSQNYIDKLNDAIVRIADDVMMERVVQGQVAMQLTDLKSWFKLTPFFLQYTDKGEGWLKAHLEKGNARYYNQFDPQIISKINLGLKKLARTIAQIHVVE